jgi:hypothetical protein
VFVSFRNSVEAKDASKLHALYSPVKARERLYIPEEANVYVYHIISPYYTILVDIGTYNLQ